MQTKIISLSTAILPPYLSSGKEFVICFLKFQKEKFVLTVNNWRVIFAEQLTLFYQLLPLFIFLLNF